MMGMSASHGTLCHRAKYHGGVLACSSSEILWGAKITLGALSVRQGNDGREKNVAN